MDYTTEHLSAFESLKMKVEAILFTSEGPLEAGEIRAWIGHDISLADVRLALHALSRDYENRAFELFIHDNRYQIRTRLEHLDLIKKQHVGKARSLSKNSLETLAIIAYRQPVTRAQINSLRGLDSSSIILALKEKDLIYPSGTRKEVGNPIEYKTTDKFLEIFGLTSLKDLPSLRSLQMNADDQRKAIDTLKSLEQVQESENSESETTTTEVVENAHEEPEPSKIIEENSSHSPEIDESTKTLEQTQS